MQQHVDRGWMQIVLTPNYLFSWNNRSINLTLAISHQSHYYKCLLGNAHSVHAGSSSLRPTRPSFSFLLHVVSFLAGRWLLIFPTPQGAWPSLAPLPWAELISLRSQAMPCSHVGHTNVFYFKPFVIWLNYILFCNKQIIIWFNCILFRSKTIII
jgi:hypothetical protein